MLKLAGANTHAPARFKYLFVMTVCVGGRAGQIGLIVEVIVLPLKMAGVLDR